MVHANSDPPASVRGLHVWDLQQLTPNYICPALGLPSHFRRDHSRLHHVGDLSCQPGSQTQAQSVGDPKVRPALWARYWQERVSVNSTCLSPHHGKTMRLVVGGGGRYFLYARVPQAMPKSHLI